MSSHFIHRPHHPSSRRRRFHRQRLQRRRHGHRRDRRCQCLSRHLSLQGSSLGQIHRRHLPDLHLLPQCLLRSHLHLPHRKISAPYRTQPTHSRHFKNSLEPSIGTVDRPPLAGSHPRCRNASKESSQLPKSAVLHSLCIATRPTTVSPSRRASRHRRATGIRTALRTGWGL